MDLSLSPAHEAFREDVRRFLDEALSDELREAGRNCAGVYCEYSIANRWHRILARQGWSAPSWPIEWGGPGWDFVQQYLFESELEAAGAPRITPNNVRMIGPVIMAFGTDQQKQRYLPRILSGDDWWAQGYSEPGAGSDLAALSCSAVKDGDSYELNGTKIWTSHAQWSNMIFCLVRTRRDGPPQAGISFVLFPMDLPGVSVQPILSLAGDHEVNQVFFDDVRAPCEGLLGRENEGWTVAKHLLEHERGFLWAPGIKRRIRQIKELDIDSALLRRRIVEAEIDVAALELEELRAVSAISLGKAEPARASVLKVRGSELRQRVTELAIEAHGIYVAVPRGALPEAEPASIAFASYLNDRAASIYAGTNEIQRNIIARILLRA